MSLPHRMPSPDSSPGEELRATFARGNAVLGRIGSILGHLLSTSDHSLFSDEIVARVRGMLYDLARQVLRVQAEATGQAGREEFADRHGEQLASHFQSNSALLAHCHALALEWQLAARMEHSFGMDPVLSPLIQDLIASQDSSVASAAMAALAAQARFAQSQRRMEIPVAELPGDLLHQVLLTWRAYNGGLRSDAIVRAEAKLRNSFDEGAGRLSLFARLVAGMDGRDNAALSIEHAGVALFMTALAVRSGQTRELAILSSNENQSSRLALGLRAAGLSPESIAETILRLHPEANLPVGIADLTDRAAHQLLAETGAPGIG